MWKWKMSLLYFLKAAFIFVYIFLKKKDVKMKDVTFIYIF